MTKIPTHKKKLNKLINKRKEMRKDLHKRKEIWKVSQIKNKNDKRKAKRKTYKNGIKTEVTKIGKKRENIKKDKLPK